jgi:hypothetical protein
MKSEILTERVRIGGIVEGNPPMLAFSKLLTRPDGKQKLHSQMVQVTDSDLLARLRHEVQNGMEADIEIETDWTHPDIPTVLKNYSVVMAHVRA